MIYSLLMYSWWTVINYLCSTSLPTKKTYYDLPSPHRVRRVCKPVYETSDSAFYYWPNEFRNEIRKQTLTKLTKWHYIHTIDDVGEPCVNACDRWCLAQRRYLRVAFLRLLIWSELGRNTEVHWRMRGVEGEKLPVTVLILWTIFIGNLYVIYRQNPSIDTPPHCWPPRLSTKRHYNKT